MPVSEVHDERTLATRRTFESHKCAQKREKIGVEADDGSQEEYVSKSLIRRKSVTFGCPEHKGVSGRRKKLCRVVQTETEECVDQTAGTRSADDLRFLAEAEMRAADPDEYLDMGDFEAVPNRNAAVLTCARVHF